MMRLIVAANGDSVELVHGHSGKLSRTLKVRHFCQVGRCSNPSNPDRPCASPFTRIRLRQRGGRGGEYFSFHCGSGRKCRTRWNYNMIGGGFSLFGGGDIETRSPPTICRCRVANRCGTAILQAAIMASDFRKKDDRALQNSGRLEAIDRRRDYRTKAATYHDVAARGSTDGPFFFCCRGSSSLMARVIGGSPWV